MSTKQCEVIQDLIPLYIDHICSDESCRIINEHLENCDECQKLYENMSKSVKQKQAEPELDSQQAFRAISHRWKRKRISIACISAALTALTIFIGYMLYQEVSCIHNYFSPVIYVDLRNLPDDEWYRVSFENTDALVFDSIFYDKEVTLDANSDSPISIRISDSKGTIVLSESTLEPGTSLALDALERNAEYTVEIKTMADFLLLRFH